MYRPAAALLILLSLANCASRTEMQMPDKPYHHLADGRFRNPQDSVPVEPPGFGTLLPFWWGMVLAGFQTEQVPDGHVLPADEVQAGMARHHNADSLTWLGHAAFLVRIGGATVLTDPYLSDHAGPFNRFGPKRYVPPALTPATLPPIDILTVSHNHYDHLDLATLDAMPDKARISVIVPLGLGSYFTDLGYTDVTELDWYQSIEKKGVTVTATPAIHFSRRGLFDGNRTLWAGFAYRAGGKNLFFSGDTSIGPVFREIGEKLGPFDLGLIGIGAYEPQTIMRGSHTTPEQAAEIGRTVRAKRMIGMHWGTVRLSEEPQFEAAERLLKEAAIVGYGPDEAGVMKIGETRAF